MKLWVSTFNKTIILLFQTSGPESSSSPCLYVNNHLILPFNSFSCQILRTDGLLCLPPQTTPAVITQACRGPRAEQTSSTAAVKREVKTERSRSVGERGLPTNTTIMVSLISCLYLQSRGSPSPEQTPNEAEDSIPPAPRRKRNHRPPRSVLYDIIL